MKRPETRLPNLVKKARNRIDRTLRTAAFFRTKSAPSYFHWFNAAFSGEMRAVLAGCAHHEVTDRGDGVENAFAFRRNIHRLEKGLIMRPRRPFFGVDYIGATVDYFVSASGRSDMAEAETALLTWARDVLTSYFEAVETGANDTVDAARDRFQRAPVAIAARLGDRKSPFDAEKRKAPKVSIGAFEGLAKNRKSIRWYLPEPVPREVLDRAVDAARFSPSACNRQPFEIRIYDDPKMISALASLPGGTKGIYENFPCLLVFVGRLRAFSQEKDRHLIYIDASLAAMSLVLALESQKVGSCIINWADVPEKECAVSELMGLEADERVVMMMSAGYPDPAGKVCWSERKPLSELRSYNKLSEESTEG